MSSWAKWGGSTLALEELDYSGKDVDLKERDDSNDYDPDDFKMEDGEEKRIIEKQSLRHPSVDQLKKVLADWITNTLEHQRIIVTDLEEDLFDGQVLQKLIEHLAKIKIDVPEVTLTIAKQQEKLMAVLDAINRNLTKCEIKWDVTLIHSKDICAILQLLVAIVQQYRAPIKLPEKVSLKVITVRKQDGLLQNEIREEEITPDSEDMVYGTNEKDAFDALFQLAPEKLNLVKKSLVEFVNRHLEPLQVKVIDFDKQFSDGVFFIFLMGILENYFVPLYLYNATPETFEDKVKNINLAFELFTNAGLPKPTSRPEDIANCELKSTLRVVYSLFTKYKHVKVYKPPRVP